MRDQGSGFRDHRGFEALHALELLGGEREEEREGGRQGGMKGGSERRGRVERKEAGVAFFFLFSKCQHKVNGSMVGQPDWV